MNKKWIALLGAVIIVVLSIVVFTLAFLLQEPDPTDVVPEVVEEIEQLPVDTEQVEDVVDEEPVDDVPVEEPVSYPEPQPVPIVEANATDTDSFIIYGEMTEEVTTLANYLSDLGMSGIISSPMLTKTTEVDAGGMSDFVNSYADIVDHYYNVEDKNSGKTYEVVVLDNGIFYEEYTYE